MAWWRFVVNALLPPPLVLLLLLIFPLPRQLRRGIVVLTDRFMSLKIVGGIQLIHFMIVVTGLAFAGSIDQTIRLTRAYMSDTVTPNQKAGFLAKKWREERNFWIAFMTFLLWCILFRFFQISRKLIQLEDQVAPEYTVPSQGNKLAGLKDRILRPANNTKPMGDPDPDAPIVGKYEVKTFPPADASFQDKKVE